MSPSEPDSNKIEKQRRLRWWPAAVIGIAALVALTWIWSAEVSNEAVRTIRTAMVVIVSLLLLLLWWMLASGLSWKARWLGLAALVLVGFLLRSLVAYDGVDGNLVPILRWSWTSRTVPDIPGSASGTHTVTVAGANRLSPVSGPQPGCAAARTQAVHRLDPTSAQTDLEAADRIGVVVLRHCR